MSVPFTLLMEMSPNPDASAQFFPEYVPLERIGVHAERLGRLAVCGGFKPNVAISYYHGDITKVEPSVAGFSGSDTAAATAAGATTEAPLGTGIYTQYDSGKGLHTAQDLTLKVNVAELEQHMQTEPGPALRDPKIWARYINTALGQGLREAAWRQMVTGPKNPAERRHEMAMARICSIASVSPMIVGMDFAEALTETMPLCLSVTIAISNFVKGVAALKHHEPLAEQCISVVPLYHVDRAAMVSVGSRVLKLAKAF